MKIKGKHIGLLERDLEPNEILESLIQDGTLMHVTTKDGKRLLRFKYSRRLYSIGELLKLLG